jgi:hypothetical protein
LQKRKLNAVGLSLKISRFFIIDEQRLISDTPVPYFGSHLGYENNQVRTSAYTKKCLLAMPTTPLSNSEEVHFSQLYL